MLPAVAGITGTYHVIQLFSSIFFSVEIGSHKLFCLGCSGTVVLWISASQVARITGVSHQSPALHKLFFKKEKIYFLVLIKCCEDIWKVGMI
jgi:hypothetical protein